MDTLQLKGATIIWSNQSKHWLFTIQELTNLYLRGKHPYTKKALTVPVQQSILKILRKVGGSSWFQSIQKHRKYKAIPLNQLRQLEKKSMELGRGKYGKVYAYQDYAIKVIKHCEYTNLPKTDGKVEAKILQLFNKNLLCEYQCPQILLCFQYTPDPNKPIDYLICEKLDLTLWKYIGRGRTASSAMDLQGVILQVLFALLVMQTVYPGFRHNDLKVDNILLQMSPRPDPLCLYYKEHTWIIPSTVPLVKIADFDYANVPQHCVNSKVGSSYSRTFGCTKARCDIYDVHLFLNSIYSYRKFLDPVIISWIAKQLPLATRGTETDHCKYGRLIKPRQWDTKIKTPLQLLTGQGSFFEAFRSKGRTYPRWGFE